MIDLHLPGDPDSVRKVGEWLADKLHPAAANVGVELAVGSDEIVSHHWKGGSADAFAAAAKTVENGSEKISGYARDAGEIFQAYAAHLERGQEAFAALLAQAREVGLEVIGEKVVNPTTSLQYCPGPGSPQEDLDEYEVYREKAADYRVIEEYVGTWWGRTEKWIAAKIAPLVEDVRDFQSLPEIVAGLTKGNEEVVKDAIDGAKKRSRRNLKLHVERAEQLQNEADEFRRRLRSGNPAVKAAADKINPQAIRKGVDELNDSISNLTRLGNALEIAGKPFDIISSGVTIATDESPTGASIELLGGMGGAGAVALTGLSPVGAAIAVAGATYFVGKGSRYMYEDLVSLEDRESLDGWLKGKHDVPIIIGPRDAWWADK